MSEPNDTLEEVELPLILKHLEYGAKNRMMAPPDAVLSLIKELRAARSANREKDAEIADLRKSLIQAGREAGAFLTDEVSTEFLRHVPEEIRLKFASLRASSGEKPEDAYRRGWMEGMMAEAHAESGVSPEVDPESFIINGIDMVPPYVAPPSLPKGVRR